MRTDHALVSEVSTVTSADVQIHDSKTKIGSRDFWVNIVNRYFACGLDENLGRQLIIFA